MIKILGIEHIGIAVKNRDKTSNFFENILGIKNPILEEIIDQKVITEIPQGISQWMPPQHTCLGVSVQVC